MCCRHDAVRHGNVQLNICIYVLCTTYTLLLLQRGKHLKSNMCILDASQLWMSIVYYGMSDVFVWMCILACRSRRWLHRRQLFFPLFSVCHNAGYFVTMDNALGVYLLRKNGLNSGYYEAYIDTCFLFL